MLEIVEGESGGKDMMYAHARMQQHISPGGCVCARACVWGYTINKEKLAQLDGASLEELNKLGILSLVYFALVSHQSC